jgi:hypothetical protein
VAKGQTRGQLNVNQVEKGEEALYKSVYMDSLIESPCLLFSHVWLNIPFVVE